MCRLTKEGIEMLLEEIVDSVEMTEDRGEQFKLVRVILESNGIIEEIV